MYFFLDYYNYHSVNKINNHIYLTYFTKKTKPTVNFYRVDCIGIKRCIFSILNSRKFKDLQEPLL